VSRTLLEARGLAEAAPRLFEAVGPGMSMDVGVLWLIEHRSSALRAAYVWRGKAANAASFEAAVRRGALGRGEGLAGGAWAAMGPVWRSAKGAPGASADPITAAARADGLRTGLAFPVRFGKEFHGVIELGSHAARRDAADLEVEAEVLGETLGQFLVRQSVLQRLGSSERQLAELFANAPLGLVVADAKGRILRANQAELDMMGVTREAYVGHALSEFHLDPSALADLFERAARGEEVRGLEVRVRRGDGTEAWIRLHANAGFEDGRLLHVRCFGRDVTQERAAARSLRESEERFRLLVEGARDYALHTYDPAGRIAAWSVGAETLFGWTDAEAVALDIAALFGPEDRAEDVPARALKLAEDEGRLLHEGWLVRKDGARFWAQVSLTSVRDPAGRVTHVCQLTRDATESRRVETLRKKTSDLEAANNAVLLAQRRTSEALDALRTAIEGPVQAVERLVARLESGEVEEAVRIARTSAASLRRALEHAGAAGSLEPVASAAAGVSIDPFRLASEVRDMLRDAAAERRIRVEVDVDPDLGEVILAPDRLRQVLFNLLSNAIRYNRDRGRATVRFLREGEQALRLEVEDTGIGIPTDRVAVLFGAEGDGGLPGGEGKVGLPATRRVVADLGGRITVRSAVGRGTVFSVVLPRTLPLRRPAAFAEAKEPPTSAPGRRARRVIVVEANPAVRANLAWTFGGAGYEVTSTDSAVEAIKASREQACDVLAAALDAAEGSVLDVVTALRVGGRSRRLAHVVCLVHAEEGPPAALLVSDVVPRPAPADRLFAALERAGVPQGREGHVLVVDGDLASLRGTARTLEALDYRVVAEPDADAALRSAADETPKAIVLSPFLLVLDVFRFLHHLRRSATLRGVPTILCTPGVLDASQAAGLRAAAAEPEGRLGDLLAELDRRMVPAAAGRALGLDPS